MPKYAQAPKMLFALKNEHGTWEAVANELSQRINQNVNVGLVWKVANKKGFSPIVYEALGLHSRRRFRRSADFKCAEKLQAFDLFLATNNLTLTQICRGILDGTIEINIKDREEQ